MQQRLFRQIDVFSHHPGFGNPVAVVLDAQGLSDADMRRFAAWTNLSETTFLMPPTAAGHAAGADYRLRIFSPRGELPFAGHPTLGTCRAWLQQGHTPRVPGLVVQESAQGLVQIEHQGDTLAFAAPPLQCSKPSPALVPLVASALGLRPHQIQAAQLLDNGPVWLGLLLDSADTVLGLLSVAYISRMTRSFMITELQQQYVIAARVKGVSETAVIWRHALRNAAVPLFTVIALSYMHLLEGSVLTETIFAWPGLGRYLTNALLNADMNAVLVLPLVSGRLCVRGVVCMVPTRMS